MDADQKKLWINGQLIEVSEEVYAAYTKGDRKMRYFEADLKTERIIIGEDGKVKKVIPSREDSLDRLMDNNAEQFPDAAETVEEAVFCRMTEKAVHKALSLLSEKERDLILALFFENKTERDVAAELGISQPAVHKRKNKILAQLKLFLEN
ncbi:MAG: sigma-70 family RNA polymerase sigma factor [Oscillospiraceae bacterium]|nr:sigma-70 family RNA polymerase sigma factor [Oscillospiraceae bacterium]